MCIIVCIVIIVEDHLNNFWSDNNTRRDKFKINLKSDFTDTIACYMRLSIIRF